MIREAVSWNPSTPPAILEKLHKDSDDRVKYGVGRNENTPLDVLKALLNDHRWALFEDSGWKIRYAVAGNIAITEEMVDELLEDHEPRVKFRAMVKPKISGVTLYSLQLSFDEATRTNAGWNPKAAKRI